MAWIKWLYKPELCGYIHDWIDNVTNTFTRAVVMELEEVVSNISITEQIEAEALLLLKSWETNSEWAADDPNIEIGAAILEIKLLRLVRFSQ